MEGLSSTMSPLIASFCALQGENQYEVKYEDNRAVCVDQYCQRTAVCKCLHLIGRRKVMGQRYSWVHRSREGILQDGKSGEFFPDIFSFESNAGTRRTGLVLEIIVSHPHVSGRGSHPVRPDGCNDLRVLLPAERDHVQGGTTQRCNTSQENLGIVERDELGALFDPACGSDSILCVVAQDLFDRRIVETLRSVMVPRAGVEPARPYGQRILSPQRLPFRHPGIVDKSHVLKYYYALFLSVTSAAEMA